MYSQPFTVSSLIRKQCLTFNFKSLQIRMESHKSKAVPLSDSNWAFMMPLCPLDKCVFTVWWRGSLGNCPKTISIRGKQVLLPQTALPLKINNHSITHLKIFFLLLLFRTKNKLLPRQKKTKNKKTRNKNSGTSVLTS